MIRITGKTTGLLGAQERMSKMQKGLSDKRLDAAAKAGAEMAASRAMLRMRLTPYGIYWPFPAARLPRRASSLPGQYPAIQYGDLVGSFNIGKIRTGVWYWEAGGSGVPQAFYMEFGTSNMLPRPFMRPTIIEYLADIQEAMRAEMAHSMTSLETLENIKAGGY